MIHQRWWFGGSALYQPWVCSSKLSEDGESAERLGGSIEAENESTKILTNRSILYVREVQIFNVGNVAKALRVLLERTVMIER